MCIVNVDVHVDYMYHYVLFLSILCHVSDLLLHVSTVRFSEKSTFVFVSIEE